MARPQRDGARCPHTGTPGRRARPVRLLDVEHVGLCSVSSLASESGTSERPTVVVVGGGFGGLRTARDLKRAPVDVVLVDKSNHHVFQPLLYQVASAALSPADIAAPIRRILRRQNNVRVVMGAVEEVDLESRVVRTPSWESTYDSLVIAAGAAHSYFGHTDWAPHAPGLKTIDEALEIRRRLLTAFEAAELEEDDEARRALLTFVVIGGGPTGVELAGAIREIASNAIPADFRRVDTTMARVILIEGRDRLLSTMSERASAWARRDLERMDVEVRVDNFVNDVNDRGILTGDVWLPTRNVLWAAGVRGAPIATMLGCPLDRVGRVIVQPDCSIPGHPEVFVIGDLAAQKHPETGAPVPGVAPAALQMGAFVARILRKEAARRASPSERPAFRYRDRGALATIGKTKAVADFGKHTVRGVGAWILWSFVHIWFLIGFRNKLFVMLSWAWNYALHTRGARLITRTPE